MKKILLVFPFIIFGSSLVGCNKSNTYIVSFDAGLGTPTPNKQEVKSNEYAIEPKEKPSYSTDEKIYYLNYWTLNGEEFNFKETPITQDITLTATYTETIRYYNIEFVNDDGSKLESQSLKFGDEIKYKGETPKKSPSEQYSYTFSGWKPELKEGDTVKANQTYIAQYTSKVNQYTVTFNSDGGTYINPITVDYNSTITEPSRPTKDPTPQKSFDFLYWMDKDGNQFNFSTPITHDFTLKAKYKETINKYAVKFICDGSIYCSYSVPYDRTIDRPSNPEKESTHDINYVFDGWYTTDTFDPDSQFNFNTHITTNIDLYGRFIEQQRHWVNVTYDLNGGTATFDTVVEVEKGFCTINPGSPTKAKDPQYTYEFKEWQLDGQKFEFESTPISQDTTLIAYYSQTINKYTVTFDTGGGTPIDSQTVEYGGHATRPSVDPTKETKLLNYTFKGWADKDGNDFDFDATTIKGNTTIYAKWESINWWEDQDYINNLTNNDVGTIRGVKVNNLIHDVRLIGINHDDLADGNGKAHTTWEFATLFSNVSGDAELCCWQSNNSKNYINSAIRKSIDGGGTSSKYGWESGGQFSILDKLDSSLKDSIKTVTKYVNTSSSTTTLTSYNTSLFQLATLEMGYYNTEAETSNVSRYDYYKNEVAKESSTRVKTDYKGNLSRVWLRSPDATTYGTWISAWTVDSESNGEIETWGLTWGGLGLDQEYEAISPAFCI